MKDNIKKQKMYVTSNSLSTDSNYPYGVGNNVWDTSTAGDSVTWKLYPNIYTEQPTTDWTPRDVITLGDNSLVKIGDKVIRWGDLAKKIEIILEILKEDIEIYEIADALTDGREEDIKLP